MKQPWVIEPVTEQDIVFCAFLAAKRVNPDAIDTCIIQGTFVVFVLTVSATKNQEDLKNYEELDFQPFGTPFVCYLNMNRSHQQENGSNLKIFKRWSDLQGDEGCTTGT